MKSRKFLGGLVVAVLLSGTTVLYLAGVDRAGMSKALGQPVPPPPWPSRRSLRSGILRYSEGSDTRMHHRALLSERGDLLRLDSTSIILLASST